MLQTWLLLLALAPGGGDFDVSVSQSTTVAPAHGDVFLAANTAITVFGHDNSEVRVSAHLPDAFEVKIDKGNDSVQVRVVPRGKPSKEAIEWLSTFGAIELLVPVAAGVELHTAHRDIEVDGVRGAVTASSQVGDIKIEGRVRSVSLDSNTGDIDIEAVDGNATATTSTGAITIDDLRGDGHLRSVAGHINVDGKAKRLDAGSISGNVTYSGSLTGPGPHAIDTKAGNVTLFIDPKKPLAIDARSITGSVDVDDFKAKDGGTELQKGVEVGKGGPELRIRTLSGHVSIMAL